MKTSHTIILDLIAGQASTAVLAERMHQPAKVLDAFLQDLEIDDLVERGSINKTVTVWRLTDAGREMANTLTQPATT